MTPVPSTEAPSEIAQKLGLTPAEYERIKGVLKREPTVTELGVFSVMYSEHCSYKNSKPILKLFPKEGPRMLVKAGEENAGVVDIGDGLCVCFKIESHNHPSAVEPFQGAATGVGGILRDIFTMGVRPILLMDSLRFGNLESARTRRLLGGVVGGIGFYGNCIGVPTVGGEAYFDPCYEGNPLVNALALGVARTADIARGKAEGIGNPVFYVGAGTGRDGIGGASFASREITEDSDRDRPAVQVGDPFMEKLLLEAILELLASGVVVGLQDMGAAGLTCSTCETAARGGSGIEIDTARVPQRETGMTPYEILLSESQERMLVIVKKGEEGTARRIFEKWDLHAVEIGRVTDTGLMVVGHQGREVARIPAKALADEGPVYVREERRPAYLDAVRPLSARDLPPAGDLGAALLKLLDSPSVASKEWIYRQYDHMVGVNTVVLPGSDAAVVRVKGTDKKIAVTTDCNALYCYLDPYEGGKIAVAEAARNLVCTGAKPLAITNCLNFGNPMKPEIFWQFRKCVEGMSEACRRFDTPVSGGNVSFYNESPEGAIHPTPVVGMVGLIEGRDAVPSAFRDAGDLIALLGRTADEMGSSEFLKVIHGRREGAPPRLDLDEAARFNALVIGLAEAGLLKSAHDLSEGGLGVALAEACILYAEAPRGAEVRLPDLPGVGREAALFGESQSRAVLSFGERDRKEIERRARDAGVPLVILGTVGGQNLRIDGIINAPLAVVSETWRKGLPRRLQSA
jgi:phosphoribosylformylglycinamidine synthase